MTNINRKLNDDNRKLNDDDHKLSDDNRKLSDDNRKLSDDNRKLNDDNFSPPTPEWKISREKVPYDVAVAEMDRLVEAIQEGKINDTIWALEHPPVYTLGTSTKPEDVLKKQFPVFKTGRGGEATYHGPGQRIIYPLLNLAHYKKDIRWYVWALEEWIIQTLAEFNLDVFRREGRVGLWVPETSWRDNKIAAIGVRVSKWVTFHGLALNVNPDLTHYEGIVPCGISDHGMTSLETLGINASMFDIDRAFQKTFSKVFQNIDK